MYTDNDPRSRLDAARSEPATREHGRGSAALLRPASFQMDVDAEDAVTPDGTRSWVVRGEQFCVDYSRVVPGGELRISDSSDEYVVVCLDAEAEIGVTAQGEEVVVRGRSVTIVPSGASSVTSVTGGDLIRVFHASTAEVARLARNREEYADGEVTPVVSGASRAARGGAVASRLRVYDLDEYKKAEGRFGRIFRSASLMVNVMYPQIGPRDPEAMSPHSHAEFDQCSITVRGDHIHHLRTPWTPIKAHWRPDEHLLCHSPSITVIPRGVVHTSEQVGDHEHLMIDVFAPPRADFLAMSGWVLNAGEYETNDDTDVQ